MSARLDYTQPPYAVSAAHNAALGKIDDHVRSLWRSHPTLPYFTTHGPDHNLAIIELLGQMLPSSMNKPEYELERFLLVVGAWLHDVGMLDHPSFSEPYDTNAVRMTHHDRSALYVGVHSRALDLSTAEADVVAYLVKMHRKKEPLEQCPEQMCAGARKVRLRQMAALLRLADALHVDESRAPDQEYDLYRVTGMPPEAKFHWVKARAVQGIDLDLAQGMVRIQIGIPLLDREKAKKIDFRPLADFVAQETESEIATVRQTLAKAGCPHITDVTVNLVPIPGMTLNSARANEIQALNSLISIDVSPNARTLAKVILQSIGQIGPAWQPGEGKLAHGNVGREPKRVQRDLLNLRDYAKDLVPKVVARRCHTAVVQVFVALVRLLEGDELPGQTRLSLQDLLDDSKKKQHVNPTEMQEHLVDRIEKIRFPTDPTTCGEILDRIVMYFDAATKRLDAMVLKLKEVGRGNPDLTITTEDRILLYGTSDSVVDLLDAACDESVKRHAAIFVAECRVKSNYASTGTVTYNDSVEYVRRLTAHAFQHVAIVPDAAIAHLLLPPDYYRGTAESDTEDEGARDWVTAPRPVTKVFIGFNGLDIERGFAVHSCGHLALVLLAKQSPSDERGRTSVAEVYLVGTTNKCGHVDYKHGERRSTKTWLMGDTKLLEELHSIDYNPVDDIIKLTLVDKVVSDIGVIPGAEFVARYNKDQEREREDGGRAGQRSVRRGVEAHRDVSRALPAIDAGDHPVVTSRRSRRPTTKR